MSDKVIHKNFRNTNYEVHWNSESGRVWIDTSSFIDRGKLIHDKTAETHERAEELGYDLLTHVAWVSDRLS